MAKDETKLCKHCKMEIPAEAKVCPHCRKRQGGVIKWIVIGIIVVAVIGTVAGGGSDNSSKTKSDTQEASTKNIDTTKEKDTKDAAAEKEKAAEKKKAKEAKAKKAADKAQKAQDAATDAVRKVWNFEAGTLADGATRDLLNTAADKVNSLTDETVKSALSPALDAADAMLTQQEQAAAEAEAQRQAAEAEAQKQAAAAAAATLEQTNALKQAGNYLSFTAFSYSGLIEQLEFEGYSAESATYAADNCGADWNEQAAKKAQSYLDFSSFSRDGLLDQLLYEGFTNEQAEYGVSAVGY